MSIYHKHHIIPKHMGGTDDPSNLIELTVEEHAEAHRKLFAQYGHWQDEVAWKGLSGQLSKLDVISEIARNTGLATKGRKLSEETKKKIAKARMGRKHSKETLEKMSKSQIGEKNHFYGRKHSDQTKIKMRGPRV